MFRSVSPTSRPERFHEDDPHQGGCGSSRSRTFCCCVFSANGEQERKEKRWRQMLAFTAIISRCFSFGSAEAASPLSRPSRRLQQAVLKFREEKKEVLNRHFGAMA